MCCQINNTKPEWWGLSYKRTVIRNILNIPVHTGADYTPTDMRLRVSHVAGCRVGKVSHGDQSSYMYYLLISRSIIALPINRQKNPTFDPHELEEYHFNIE